MLADMQGLLIVLGIIYTIALLIIYHKCFTVVYTNAFYGLMREVIFAACLGFLLMFATIYFWYIAVIVILIIGVYLAKKMQSKTPIIAVAVLAIIMCMIGYKVESAKKNSESPAESSAEATTASFLINNFQTDDCNKV